MGAAESPCHRGGGRVCETHVAEGTAGGFQLGIFNVAPAGWRKLPAC